MLPFFDNDLYIDFYNDCFKLKSLRLILLLFYDDLMLLIVDCVVNNMSIEKFSIQ
jgi:hypothetical protein